MLKKKNIATMMAAATVVTSVAPVFAAETEADVVERIEAIESTTVLKKGQEETNQLIKDLRFLLNEGSKFEVVSNDKVNGQFSYTTTSTVTVNINKGDSVYAIVMTDAKGNKKLVKSIVEIENAIDALNSKDGNIDSIDLQVIDKGHAIVDGKISAINGRGQNIIQNDINEKITITAADANTTVFTVEELFDGEYLTQKGFELYSAINNKDNLINGEEFKSIELQDGEVINVIEPEGSKEQVITFKLDVVYVDSAKEKEVHTITIKGKDLAHTTKLAYFLNEDETVLEDELEVGVSRIAGEDRFKTAVKIAKERTSEATVRTDEVSNIVLVNAESMIDGLTATPLAEMLNASVLLTNKDAVQKDTLDYIKSLDKVNVTIVGGTGVVSEAVVRQLEKEGIKVERIGGEDRHATSVEVGIKMRSIALANGDTIDNAFIVASNGESDAMSIAPVAAEKKAPIIVEGFDGMTTTSKELLKDAKNNNKVDIIGGKVSSETKEFYKKNGVVVYGYDRYDTNAKVVERYYSDKVVENIFVAKDGMANSAQLVDALAVGSLAIQEKAPIILATDNLSTRQKEAIKAITLDDKTQEVKQIGGGVNFSNVVKTVAKILGYTK